MTLEADIAALKKLPLFRALPSPRLKLVALMGEKLSYAPGDALVESGTTPDGMFVILSGEVELSHREAGEHGRRIRLGAGMTVGDVPMLCGQSHTAEVTAATDVVALRLPKDIFFELLQTVPDFNAALTRDLASRLYKLAHRVLDEEKAD